MATSRAFPHFENRVGWSSCAWQASSQDALLSVLCVLKTTYVGVKCSGCGESLSAPVANGQRMPVGSQPQRRRRMGHT